MARSRRVTLASLGHIPTPTHDVHPPALMQRAREAQVAAGLSYEQGTGIVRHGNTRVSWPSKPEHLLDATDDEIMDWQFAGLIGNSASRLSRGLTP